MSNRPLKINILGGGPAGLYFALLMKKADARNEVLVVERDGPDDTFGWGIVFSDRTLSYLRDNDEPTHAAITAAFEYWDNVDVAHRDARISIRGNRFSGIGRLAFLNIFQQRCRELGVQIHYRTNCGDADVERLRDADLFIGADGANSTVRRRYAGQFGPSVDLRRNKYIWLGTPRLFHGLTLTFRQNEHGAFAAHSYKFNKSTSTFIVECSAPTWNSAGFGSMAEAQTLAYLQNVFAPDLQDQPLLSNNFVRWINFPLIKNRRWFFENTVLLGDALHTAHFSIGSGTKLAVEDSIALFQCMASASSVAEGLAEFERRRRPTVEALQEAAFASLVWFENMADHLDQHPLALAYELMTRSGRITHEDLRRRDPDFVAQYETWKAAGG